MVKKKKEILLTVLALVSLVVITVGVTYAFFNYAKEGSTENSITTGTITFLYTEVSGVGNGISLSDAYPISDAQGKAQTGAGNVFDFKVTSTTPNKTSIPYEVTARKKSDSTLAESAVRMYLTKVSGTDEEEVLLDNYSNLTQTTKVDSATYTEKTIYQGKVPANSTNHEQAFRLRMWIDENTDFSDGSMNSKTFTVTVNVYANAKVVTDEQIALESNANISSLAVEGNVLALVEGQDYDYATTLLAGTTNATINIETENEYATVSVERIDSLVYSSNIQRLSINRTVNLVSGDNYFKVIVTSENKEVVKEYKVKITVAKDTDNTLKSLSLTNCPLNETFNSNITSYTCNVENNATATIVSAQATSSVATLEGVKEYSLVTGENTITITVTSESGDSKVYTVIVTKPKQVETVTIFNKQFEVIDAEPTLTTSSNNTSDASGLYKSTDTNDGSPTYYFRGKVENNYVSFAGQTWRVVRVNEDGTIRMIMANGINNDATYAFNSSKDNYTYMYYTNSNAKSQLETWYTNNIANNINYASKVASGNYFCEQAKVKINSSYSSGSATMTVYSSYTPNFKCATDGNGKGLVNASIGLINYDEAVFAGGYCSPNNNYYLYDNNVFWTMSPSGIYSSRARGWYVDSRGFIDQYDVTDYHRLRPVLNLHADIQVIGSGTITDPFVVQ